MQLYASLELLATVLNSWCAVILHSSAAFV